MCLCVAKIDCNRNLSSVVDKHYTVTPHSALRELIAARTNTFLGDDIARIDKAGSRDT